MSCNTVFSPPLAKTTPVSPPVVKRMINPIPNKELLLIIKDPPYKVANQLKILIPVGTAMIIVAALKYALESTSIPTVNI